jgi:hypothetical protein
MREKFFFMRKNTSVTVNNSPIEIPEKRISKLWNLSNNLNTKSDKNTISKITK